MDFDTLHLNYLDLKEFFYKFFALDLNPISLLSSVLQLAFLGWLTYQIYQRFKGTQAERVLRGLISLVPLILACYLFKLTIVTKLFEILSSTMLIALIVIFAPEFRRVLMQIGGQYSSLEMALMPESKRDLAKTVTAIVEALKAFKESKTGAIIVLEKAQVDRYYVNPGYQINATVSKEILLTVFSPKSPIHDGAVTIRGSRLVAAAVILPMTENPKLDWQYGTRHRAAIGFSEVTDSLAIIVSEETGQISFASQGRIHKSDNLETIRQEIEKFYAQAIKSQKSNNDSILAQLYNFFKPNKEAEKKAG